MNTDKRHRFPPDMISYAVWLYYRFNLNLSHSRCAGPFIEGFLAERGTAAKCIFKRLLRSHRNEPRKIVTDKLRSYGVAHRELMPDAIHDNSQYANNRVEQSHEVTRVWERGMSGPASRRFKWTGQAQRLLGAHAAVSTPFNLGRHPVRAPHYRDLRVRSQNGAGRLLESIRRIS
jgi:putative transposase